MLVEDVVILHAFCNRMMLILDSYRELVRLRVTAEIAAEEFIIKPARWVHRVRIMHSEKPASLTDEVPYGLLLAAGHPCGLGLSVAVGPITAVAGNDQQRMIGQGFRAQGRRIFNKRDRNVLSHQRRDQSIAHHDWSMVDVPNEGQRARPVRGCINWVRFDSRSRPGSGGHLGR